MPNPLGRRTTLAAVALLVVGFGGGFLTARLAAPKHALGAATPASGGFAWPNFGRLRATDAPRALPKKPDGFAVWTSRFDVQASGPRACIRMTRMLDPRRAYGDF